MRRSLLLLPLLCGPPASARPPQDMLASMVTARAASLSACGAGCACSRPGACGHEGCDCVGFERTAARSPAAPAYAPPAYLAPPYSAPPPYLTPPLRYLAPPAPAYYSGPFSSGGGCAGGACAAGFR